MNRIVVGAVLLVSLAWGSVTASAQPGMDKDPLSFDRQIRPLLGRFCYRCHDADEPSGDVNLRQDENPNLILLHRETWATALEMIQSNQMPPQESRQPSDEDRERLVLYLTKKLNEFDCDSVSDPGTPAARRLTRLQYNRVVADLTGLDLGVAEQFSPDPTSYGFAGLGDAMGLSPVLVQQYERAAGDVARAVRECRESDPEVFGRLFGDPNRDDQLSTRRVIEAFAGKAFRRPVDARFVDSLVNVYEVAKRHRGSHVVALSEVFRAVMMSPRFFMRIETPSADSPPETPYLVDGYDLASRMSFFLWSSPPDDPLLEAARRGELHDPDTLVGQTRRMLSDPRVRDGLVSEFFAQWLQLSQIEEHQVDADAFPDFDSKLRDSMRDEAYALLTHMIRRDRPVTDLVDTNFTFLDERLATHYGIASVQGDHVRRVPLTDRRRGGLLTSAALLMVQSDPGRTNVPRRGNFIAGVYLGDPPPPPPPDVPQLEEVADDGQPRPLRELLEQHRKSPQCASCHAKMDPLGFALENYDAVGRWRAQDAGLPIDASGQLLGGETFTGPAQLKDVLLSRQEKLVRALTEKLVIYSLGRGLRQVDECTIRDAVDAAKANDDRFSAIVIEIINSFPFRYRSDPPF